ncbi:MAG: HD-GYP domain-containing protein [Thermotogae bacterium]|nr:MAG: HD-GYP domain-containing protein [Thermotogota bacterium]
MAKRLGLSDETVEKIYWSALRHDSGKVAVSKETLNKKQRLSEEDYEKIKQHPVVASELLEGYAGLTEYAKIIRHHHERWDGKGYPDGLKGEEIPLESRIMAVADAFDAMTSDRPYRKTLSVEVAKDQLIRGSKTQFDDRLVRIMISIIEEDLQAEGFSSG